MNATNTLITVFFFFSLTLLSQPNNNGKIDDASEYSKKETVYIKTKDGIKLATDIYVPVFQDCVITTVTISSVNYPIQLIPKNTQYIVYDTTNFNKNNLRLPIVFVRTPYDKTGDDLGGTIFPFLGYGYAIQDMRGRYESEGVYFPMFSDSWQKKKYMPNNPIPMDLFPTSSTSNALFHSDGSESVFFLSDSLYRVFDYDLNGTLDTFKYCNNKIGMYGASALGNSQYQAVSNIPFTKVSPLKCLMPIVAANEHYNSTLFHNGVYRNSLANGWLRGQMYDIQDSLNYKDSSLFNNIHTPRDYGYTTKTTLTEDMIDWFVADPIGGKPSGAHPSSLHRHILDASVSKINTIGESDSTGNLSRYKNLNLPIYHLTGWWDIFINGQIETFNRTKNQNPSVMQKMVIGPWTHQTIGSDTVGDMIYPQNVKDILGIDVGSFGKNFLSDSTAINNLFSSELLGWYRTHLGGEPFFFIPESNVWQTIGSSQIRVPAKNYFLPYTEFLNFLGGYNNLTNVPIEIKSGTTTTPVLYSIPAPSPPAINLISPLTAFDANHFYKKSDIRAYVSGPTNDAQNIGVGNHWISLDSLPFKKGIKMKRYYIHQNSTFDTIYPSSNEGTLSYVSDPSNPVITIGGNNMIVKTPQGKKSQGSMNLADALYSSVTMNRPDVLKFESNLLTDTLTIIGMPKASIYVKSNSSVTTVSQTDFDVMIRVLDVYPDGREMFITEGVVNARARDYARSIYNGNENNASVLTNILNNQYYYLQFEMLPLAHTFGKNHKIKILLSSSNFPKYQSNPQIPIESNQFFRWWPGSTATHNFQGNNLSASTSTITYDFTQAFPNYIEFPVSKKYPVTSISKEIIENNTYYKFYPNPLRDKLSIEFNDEVTTEIMIYDLSGKLLISKNVNHINRVEIDTQGLSSGAYILFIDKFQEKNLIIKN